MALVVRAKGQALQSATSQAVYKTMSEILQEAKESYNDKVLANCASTLGFLSAHSNDPSQMTALFSAFDGDDVDAITLPLKFSVLINGNEKIAKTDLAAAFEAKLTERLVDSAGFQETDDDPAPIAGGDEDEIFRFKGVLDLAGYFLNKFGRREWCQKADSAHMKMVFNCFNKAQLFKKLAAEDSVSSESYELLTGFLTAVPVKIDLLTQESGEMLTDAYKCVQAFYLAHDAKFNEASTDAILNLCQLNYDNYIDFDTFKVTPVTKEITGAKLEQLKAKGILTQDMRIYADDIVFKKK